MEILRKYFSGQLSSNEEAQVQNWLLDHSDEAEVTQALELIMSEYNGEDYQRSAEAFASVCSLFLEIIVVRLISEGLTDFTIS